MSRMLDPAGTLKFRFPVMNRAADVPGHQALGVGGAALVDGCQDLAVLGGIRALPVGLRAPTEEETAAHLDEPERFDHPHELFVARGPRERKVEASARIVRLDTVARLLLVGDGLPHEVEIPPRLR